MASFIFRFCDTCCPWLRMNKEIGQFHNKVSETQQQQFMKEMNEHQNEIEPNVKKIQTYQQFDTLKSNEPSQKQQKIQDLLLQQLEVNKYTDYISKEHPYFDTLAQKLPLLKNIFQIDVEPQPKVPQTKYNLKIYIKQSEDEKRNIFLYTFTFPTNFDFYEEIQNNFKLQKNFDTNIDHYECRQIIDQKTKIIYLAYKKMLIVQPRDFVYVRYTFKEGDNIFWSVATSLPDQQTYHGTVRGSIILTVTRVIQNQDCIDISVYSEVDMKMGIKQTVAKTRGVSEIKKYLDKCFEYIQKQKNNVL